MISPKDLASIRVRFAEARAVRGIAIWAVAAVFPAAPLTRATQRTGGTAPATGAGSSRPRLCWVTSKNSEGRAGIGYKAIAAATGLAKSTLAMILTGKRTETKIVVTANARACVIS